MKFRPTKASSCHEGARVRLFLRDKGCLDLCTHKLLGEAKELDSPCVIELFSGMESEALFAIESEWKSISRAVSH